MQSRASKSARRTSRRIVLLGTVAAVLLGAVSMARAELKPGTVRLVVDYGDGVETHYKAIAWREGLTVLDVLSAAKKHARPLTYSQRGSGRGALITQIGDLANEGGGAADKNWMYTINGKAPEIGAGEQTVQPKDVILWKFQVYEYNP
jgi:hypothetical protein